MLSFEELSNLNKTRSFEFIGFNRLGEDKWRLMCCLTLKNEGDNSLDTGHWLDEEHADEEALLQSLLERNYYISNFLLIRDLLPDKRWVERLNIHNLVNINSKNAVKVVEFNKECGVAYAEYITIRGKSEKLRINMVDAILGNLEYSGIGVYYISNFNELEDMYNYVVGNMSAVQRKLRTTDFPYFQRVFAQSIVAGFAKSLTDLGLICTKEAGTSSSFNIGRPCNAPRGKIFLTSKEEDGATEYYLNIINFMNGELTSVNTDTFDDDDESYDNFVETTFNIYKWW